MFIFNFEPIYNYKFEEYDFTKIGCDNNRLQMEKMYVGVDIGIIL